MTQNHTERTEYTTFRDLDEKSKMLSCEFAQAFGQIPKHTADLEAFEHVVLKDKPLFTREYIEASARDRDAAGSTHLLEWSMHRSGILARNPEWRPTDKIPNVKPEPWRIAAIKSVGSVPFDKTREQWEASQLRSDLVYVIRDCAVNMPVVEKIICIGLGTMSTQLNDVSHKHTLQDWKRNVTQHLAANSVRDTLNGIYANNGGNASPVHVLAQDPAYTNTDKEILSSLNIEVLNDPDAFFAIDEHTLVFYCCCVAPVFEVVADLTASCPGGKGPAAIIGNTLENVTSFKEVTSGDWETPRVRRFLQRYHPRDFKHFSVPDDEMHSLWDEMPWLWGLGFWYRKN